MKKYILLLIGCLVLLPLSIQGKVVTGTQVNMNLSLSYPLVYTDNETAQYNINTDIAKYVEAAKATYYHGGAYSVRTKYIVTYEDDHVISIIIKRSDDFRGAHTVDRYNALVYDKITGNKIPLSNFIQIDSATQLNEFLQTRKFPVLNYKYERIYNFYMPKRISSDYYLMGDGIIGLLYQPYELSSYANGMTTIVFTPETIDYMNRLKTTKYYSN